MNEVKDETLPAERKMTDDEKKFIDQELEGTWVRGNPNDRLDILFITSANDVQIDVAEVFSVPRICKMAQKLGLSSGGSYDILTGWDLSSEVQRKELRAKLTQMKPRFVMISPPCGPYSQLQGLNKHQDLKQWLKKLQEAKQLMRFGMDIAEDQVKRGDLFGFEHPYGAKSWNDPSVDRVLKLDGVQQVVFDQCMYGLCDKGNQKRHRKKDLGS